MSIDTQDHRSRSTQRLLDQLEKKQDALTRAMSHVKSDEPANSASRLAANAQSSQHSETQNKQCAARSAKKKRMITAYQILGISANASQKDIFAAYRQMALRWHPDRQDPQNRAKAAKCFQLVQAAYEHIKTRDAREQYDKLVKQGRAADIMAPLGTYQAHGANDNPARQLKKQAVEALGAIFWPFDTQNSAKRKQNGRFEQIEL